MDCMDQYGQYGRNGPDGTSPRASAHGNRLFIRSNDTLYCIGDALQGTVADDPTEAAKWQASAE